MTLEPFDFTKYLRAERFELPTSGEEGKEKERRRRRRGKGRVGCEVIPMFGCVAQHLKSSGQAQHAASPAKNQVTHLIQD